MKNRSRRNLSQFQEEHPMTYSMTQLTGWNRLPRLTLVALITLSLLFAATSAKAACGGQEGRSVVSLKLPFQAQVNSQSPPDVANPSIVGLWHVTYTASDSTPFYEAYDVWHADGTEFENANLTPIESNVCMGVWKKVGSRTVHLNHVGWSFDSFGNPNGTFTLTETNTVSKNGALYEGTFDYKFFDPQGNLLQEVTGTLKAARITAD
jgi:hypothetical protein